MDPEMKTTPDIEIYDIFYYKKNTQFFVVTEKRYKAYVFMCFDSIIIRYNDNRSNLEKHVEESLQFCLCPNIALNSIRIVDSLYNVSVLYASPTPITRCYEYIPTFEDRVANDNDMIKIGHLKEDMTRDEILSLFDIMQRNVIAK